MKTLKKIGRRLVDELRGRLAKVDPKVITTTLSGVVSGVAVDVGLDPSNPAVAYLVGIVVGAIVGALTPNAGTGLENRWRPPAGAVDEEPSVPGIA